MRTTLLASGLLLAFSAGAQTFDFEPGEPRWTADPVFATQPVDARQLKSGALEKVSLGGDYWQGLRYPLGQHGDYLIATAENNLGDSAIGTLVSPDFPVTAADRYLSFLVGGSNDPARERVEFQVLTAGEYYTFFSATGRTEALHQEVYRIPDAAIGHQAHIRIVDASPSGHINVDYIQLGPKAPPAPRTPVWGYADYHTHPMSYLAFGALQEDSQRVIWGYPGGNFDLYNTYNIACDEPHCVPGHKGGPLSELFVNVAQSVSATTWSKWTLRAIFPHAREGGPEFTEFPSFYRGAHEQMHITQIHRNYEGGLRLMVGLATDNLGAEYLTSHTHEHKVDPVKPVKSLEAQICGMLRMAELNSRWMEIAYTAEQARDIILRDKLAIVMGVEMDQLMELDPDHLHTPAEDVEYLWKLGIRAVTPVHAIDNRIGGPAMFEDPYNWDNDLVHRKTLNSTWDELNQPGNEPQFFRVEEDTPRPVVPGETVLFRLNPTQARVFLARIPGSFFRLAPFALPWAWGSYNPNGVNPPGHKNTKGLEPAGFDYIRALMAKGMIVDTAHMSDRSLANVFQIVDDRYKACQASGDADCSQYPVIVSHAHFREQMYYNDPNAPQPLLPSEYDIGTRNLTKIGGYGGVVGPFTSQAAIDQNAKDLVNDCAMSSKSFGIAVHYAVEHLGRGVGFATDFTFIPGVAPRFGSNACAGYKALPHLRYVVSKHREHHHPERQTDAIVYDGIDQRYLRRGTLGHNAPLTPYRMGDRTYDFNVDGLAHYGMIPDLLQDLKNVDPHANGVLQVLFSSAEDYLQMWEKSERLSACNAANAFCQPTPPVLKCSLPGAPACDWQ